MSLIHHNLFEPYERSFFDDPFFREFDREVLSFDDDTSKPKNHHHLISTKHKHFPHHIWHHHHKEDDRNQDPFHKVKKQMTKAFDKDVFKMVDFCPSINISEDDKAFYIHADLPGMTKDQVKMELDYEDHILTISGERKSIYKDNNGKTEKEEKDQKQKEEKKEDKEKEEDKENEEETTSNNETDESNENETKLTKQAENSKEIQKKNNCRYSVMECSYGSFSRSFTIPEDANIDNIKAKMENGVLNITINKIKEQKHKNRSIQIQ